MSIIPYPHSGHHKNNVRFYAVMSTLIIGGIFIFLLMNNNGNLSLTGKIVGEDNSSDTSFITEAKENVLKQEVRQRSPEEARMTLDFNGISIFEEAVEISGMDLTFSDSAANILINDDKLELQNLNQAILRLEDYKGTLKFDQFGISMEGLARRVAVNDVAFSSNKVIKVSFSDLNYERLSIESVEINDLSLDKGEGKLVVDEKLEYKLEDNSLEINKFWGEVVANKLGGNSLYLDGNVKGLTVEGDDWNFYLG